MSLRRHIGNPEYLMKRIPQNPRYQHVKSRLDTDYRYKKDELFKRLKVTTFAQLIIQVASLSDQTLEVTAEEIQRLEDNDSAASDPDAETTARTNGKGNPGEQSLSPEQLINSAGAGDSSRSTLQSVISGVGELDLDKGPVKKAEPNTKDKPYPDCPFLLLDVRDRDSYQQCHIVGAYSYPIATLSRTMNPYSNDILEYKNAHGKIIILYDDDERLASQAATTMCERGFENLFMLSGGRLNQANSSGRDSKVPGARSTQNLPGGGPASHSNPRSLSSGHLQGKPWK
ncbi:PREDICTED: centrosomal protein of 41 kDa isoform X4 [Colobus angolensis palliatus]|uniref:Rhodanese domain-containing protein n=1 Tax=Colobus angolensis palliatus TaxID=336983 RepID=A0A2K5JI44_COLAP|nr:PREDICTED: centrosomal protein of 41 kDa isoform X4 [Colobus angolensis palliatus]